MRPDSAEVLGLDIGQQHIGVARGSLAAHIAEPLTSFSTSMAAEALPKLIKDHAATALIIGLPRGLNGQETDQTRWTRDWLDQLKPLLTVPVHWQDEALTSQNTDHAGAAARILQDWLDDERRKG